MPRMCHLAVADTGDYGVEPRARIPAESIADAWTVSSRCDDGYHRPALDLDHDVALVTDRQRRWLWVPFAVTAERRQRRALRHLGLDLDQAPPHGPLWDAADPQLAATAAALADTHRGGFETLLSQAAQLAGLRTDRLRPFERTGGSLLGVSALAWLLPSTTPGHHHLYVDLPVRWRVYQRGLRAGVDVGLLEVGYVNASVARCATELRRPGRTKADDPATLPP